MRRYLSSFMLAAAVALVPQSALAAAPSINSGVVHPFMIGHTVHNGAVSSTNWSGYAVEASTEFTEVTGTWAQPTASCTTSGATYAAFWVGIDGYTSSSVEQLGTDSDCKSKSHPSYYAWYEMYPADSVSLSTTTYPVEPGDTLTGTVTRSGTAYTLSLKSSRGWTFSINKSGSDANSSAEWIAEAPEICNILTCSNAKLTNFGTVSFTGSDAAAGGALAPVSSFTSGGGPFDITMTTSSGTTRAQPGALGSGGASFSDVWHHA